MFYYEVNVLLGEDSYSFAITSDRELNDAEVIKQAEIDQKFDYEWDSDDAVVEEITVDEYNSLYK